MNAPELRSVDIHAHFYPETYLQVIAEEGARFGAEYRKTEKGHYLKAPIAGVRQLAPRIVDAHERIAEMDKQGIDVHAMSLTLPMVYWGDAEFNAKLARAWNDGATAAHQLYPTRLFGFAALPMLDPDRAIDELNRAAGLPGIRGVYMGTAIKDRDLDDPLFEPIWSHIEKLDLPVFLHPLETIGGKRLEAYFLPNILGNPFDTAVAACHLIFGGVLDRYPTLQISLPHAGGALPILIGRIDHGWKVRPETKHLQNPPSSYLRRFTYDTISHSKKTLEFVISEVGADRVMIGSDYCLDMGYSRPIEFLDQIALTSEQRNLIMGGTAAQILKL